MSSQKLWTTNIPRIGAFALIFAVIFGWIFSVWPQILNNPRTPPKTKEALEAVVFEKTQGEIGTTTPVAAVSINVSLNYPDDLIYDGTPWSVGLTLEPMLKMKWWGIAVYNETDTFVAECVSTALPLPTAIFNLAAENYKTGISLGETREGCEAFDTAEYPLFAIIEAANFIIQ
ncbi:MAG: hypothetical protein HZC03_02310 [Candidatus Lloydbacteria bacterium]|nr:hypothetical protein [Candidatus Lloydbacteria bacterium]